MSSHLNKQIERRSQFVEEIVRMIEQRGFALRTEVAAELGIPQHAAKRYLSHMHRNLRLIRKGTRHPDGSIEWVLGEDLSLAPLGTAHRKVAPARQVGMWRDWTVAALFGPAHQN